MNKIGEEMRDYRRYMKFLEIFRKNTRNQMKILELKNTMFEMFKFTGWTLKGKRASEFENRLIEVIQMNAQEKKKFFKINRT